MPSPKRRRTLKPSREPPPPPEAAAAPEPSPLADQPTRTLPADLLLEIVARTDAATLFRSAACCKPLRRDILSPAFIRRVCDDEAAGGIVPPCVLGFLRLYDKERTLMPRPPAPFALVNPVPHTAPAAASFAEAHLAPFLSRGANADVLGRYAPLRTMAASRDGFVVLCLRHISKRGRSDICVFDPMTGNHAFFPEPPDVGQRGRSCRYALLTASADGISCSFILLAAEITGSGHVIRVQTVSSSDAAAERRKWGPVAIASHPRSPGSYFGNERRNAVVLGGLIHWLMRGSADEYHVLTYDVATTTAGSIELPVCARRWGLLASSPDGRLRFLVKDKFTISVWELASGAGDDAVWVQHAVIDAETALPALLPELGVLSVQHRNLAHGLRGEERRSLVGDLLPEELGLESHGEKARGTANRP